MAPPTKTYNGFKKRAIPTIDLGVSRTPMKSSSLPTTISQGTAAMSKSATPAMKKAILDRQHTFITEGLYQTVKSIGEEMELEDPSWLFTFYHSHIVPYLTAQVEAVKTLKTGGKDAPHISRFTPLNKFMMMDLDYVDIAEGIRSAKQLGFYKMLVYKIVSAVNLALKTEGFKGKICLKRGFYSKLEEYWKTTVLPEVETQRAAAKAAEEEEEGEVESTEVESTDDGGVVSTASNHGDDEEVSCAQELDLLN